MTTKNAIYSESMYTYEVSFAINMCILLWNLTLLMDIKFGKQPITHLSVRPYLVSLAMSFVLLFESIILSYVGNITMKDSDLLSFFLSMYNTDTITSQIETPINFAKVSIILVFVLMRAHEQEALLFFCLFQRKLRVEQLEVYRDSFRRSEKKLGLVFVVLPAVLVPLPIIFYIIIRYIYFLPLFLSVIISPLYYQSIFVATLVIYNSSSISLFNEMRLHHKMAYEQHVRPFLVLFFSSEFSLLMIMYGQMKIIFLAFCSKSES